MDAFMSRFAGGHTARSLTLVERESRRGARRIRSDELLTACVHVNDAWGAQASWAHVAVNLGVVARPTEHRTDGAVVMHMWLTHFGEPLPFPRRAARDGGAAAAEPEAEPEPEPEPEQPETTPLKVTDYESAILAYESVSSALVKVYDGVHADDSALAIKESSLLAALASSIAAFEALGASMLSEGWNADGWNAAAVTAVKAAGKKRVELGGVRAARLKLTTSARKLPFTLERVRNATKPVVFHEHDCFVCGGDCVVGDSMACTGGHSVCSGSGCVDNMFANGKVTNGGKSVKCPFGEACVFSLVDASVGGPMLKALGAASFSAGQKRAREEVDTATEVRALNTAMGNGSVGGKKLSLFDKACAAVTEMAHYYTCPHPGCHTPINTAVKENQCTSSTCPLCDGAVDPYSGIGAPGRLAFAVSALSLLNPGLGDIQHNNSPEAQRVNFLMVRCVRLLEYLSVFSPAMRAEVLAQPGVNALLVQNGFSPDEPLLMTSLELGGPTSLRFRVLTRVAAQGGFNFGMADAAALEGVQVSLEHANYRFIAPFRSADDFEDFAELVRDLSVGHLAFDAVGASAQRWDDAPMLRELRETVVNLSRQELVHAYYNHAWDDFTVRLEGARTALDEGVAAAEVYKQTCFDRTLASYAAASDAAKNAFLSNLQHLDGGRFIGDWIRRH